jgi:hypothetical protein
LIISFIFFLRLVVALTQAMRVELGNVTASLEALTVRVYESERYGLPLSFLRKMSC